MMNIPKDDIVSSHCRSRWGVFLLVCRIDFSVAYREKSASPSAHSIRSGFIGVTGDIMSERGESTTLPSMFFRHDDCQTSFIQIIPMIQSKFGEK
mmetsp:Transcript_34070/g.66357  ORF Transcript_34070/g.66357 Transcript_34070/m.66357 type:complete len:95 (+) Transcript_34070:247-531(+)